MKFLLYFLLTVSALAGDVPNDRLTPGVINPLIKDPCKVLWGLDHRHVTEKMKRDVLTSYGIPWEQRKLYEVDHRVPRELCGADAEGNLWPQLWPSAHKKDRLENAVHKKLCAGEITLKEAQGVFLGDWTVAYKRYFP
jgi:hypothetical protein